MRAAFTAVSCRMTDMQKSLDSVHCMGGSTERRQNRVGCKQRVQTRRTVDLGVYHSALILGGIIGVVPPRADSSRVTSEPGLNSVCIGLLELQLIIDVHALGAVDAPNIILIKLTSNLHNQLTESFLRIRYIFWYAFLHNIHNKRLL